MKATPKPVVTNDEVAAILNGLRLDRGFFLGKLHGDLLEELKPLQPDRANACEGSEQDSRMQRRRSSIEALSAEALRKRLEKERLKAQQKATAAGRARTGSVVILDGERARVDFDVYLNQALLPVLAQSLDSLCRQLNHMEEQGDALDPLVRARFNPLTWLAQQLLRRHPRCARTPRRQAVYRNFHEWSDQERGRREMLRLKDVVHQVFSGFVLRGTVQRATIPKVVNAIDDTLKLNGVLKNNPQVQRAMGPTSPGPDRHATQAKLKSQFFQGDAWSFSNFWYQLANLLLAHDIVPYSAIEQGARLQAQELQDRLAREEAQQAMEESRKQKEADQRRQVEEYAQLHERLMADQQILAILQENKILTGDDMRPGDLGYDFEVPPKGEHVFLLSELMDLLGFQIVHEQTWTSEQSDNPAEEEWWTNDKADSWSVLQIVHDAGLADGVVEKEVLEKVLVPPEGFLLLKSRVEDEFERRAEAGEGDYMRRASDIPTLSYGSAGSKKKPTMEALCERLGMTMARMTWLHELFESYLVPEEDAPKDGPPPACGYPENPASIHKPQMRALVSEVNPNLTEAEFDARFRRIDEDGSGEIEFDEFVAWVHNDEIQVVGSARKMPTAELAQAYGEPLELIHYLHTCFKDQLPEGQVDRYPDEPVGLPKAEVQELLELVTLQRASDEEFEADWQIVDANEKGSLDFDEFLEILDFGELPAEIRERYQ